MLETAVQIFIVQTIIGFSVTAILLGLFIIYFATGKVRYLGLGFNLLGFLGILFMFFTQIPIDDPIIDIGMESVEVFKLTLGVVGIMFGMLIGILLFLLLLMKK